MELRRITGPDMRTALRMVREQLGPDAVILSNRRTAAGVEIVVGPEQGWSDPDPLPEPAPVRALVEKATAAPAPVTPAPLHAAASARDAVGWNPDDVHSLHSELQGLREMLERNFGDMRIDRMSWGPGVEGRAWRILTRMGLPNALVHELVSAIDGQRDWDAAWTRVASRLANGLVAAGDVASTAEVLAVVGPTGAGKTTTLAKLAVRHVLEHGPEGLVLASFDASRIGGSELLRSLSKLLDVPFLAAAEGESVADLIARAGASRLLLIDTAGRTARRAPGYDAVAGLGSLAGRLKTLLVLPANAQQAWLATAFDTYADAAPMAVVITRIDEAVSLGEVIGAAYVAGLPLAYTCDGQEIPDDLQVADAVGLVGQALALDPDSRAPSRDRHSACVPNAARMA